MKKTILTLIPLLLLTSCTIASEPSESEGGSETPYSLSLNVATPSGAPAIAFYKYLDSSYLEVNSNANNVVAYLTSGSDKDIVVAPTNAGVSAIVNKSAPYKIAATLTFGNFYIAATGNDDDGVMDADDYVVGFQETGVPGLLFDYVYGKDNFTNLHWLSAVSDASKCLITGVDESNENASVDYVLIAQPALKTALNNNTNASIYSNIQDLYKEKSGNKTIMQASVFVSNDADTDAVDTFLAALESDVNELLEDPSVIATYTSSFEDTELTSKIGGTAATVQSLIEDNNSIGIGYKNAYENKADIDAFLGVFGIGETSEEIYYQ